VLGLGIAQVGGNRSCKVITLGKDGIGLDNRTHSLSTMRGGGVTTVRRLGSTVSRISIALLEYPLDEVATVA
jgi:hypothetical protein